MLNGWIKLHRKFAEWEWYKDSKMVHLFIHMLLKANHEPKKWMGVDVDTGQFISGRKQLAEDTGITEQSIRTYIKRLKSTGELTSRIYNKFSLFTIKNYKKYQIEETTNQQTNQQLTSNQPATNHKQELKKEKNERNIYTDSFNEFWIVYPKKSGKRIAFKRWNEALKRDTADNIISGAKRYAKICTTKRTETCYIKNPEGWLNADRWMDEASKESTNGYMYRCGVCNGKGCNNCNGTGYRTR